jgi:hypothetical protein
MLSLRPASPTAGWPLSAAPMWRNRTGNSGEPAVMAFTLGGGRGGHPGHVLDVRVVLPEYVVVAIPKQAASREGGGVGLEPGGRVEAAHPGEHDRHVGEVGDLAAAGAGDLHPPGAALLGDLGGFRDVAGVGGEADHVTRGVMSSRVVMGAVGQAPLGERHGAAPDQAPARLQVATGGCLRPDRLEDRVGHDVLSHHTDRARSAGTQAGAHPSGELAGVDDREPLLLQLLGDAAGAPHPIAGIAGSEVRHAIGP